MGILGIYHPLATFLLVLLLGALLADELKIVHEGVHLFLSCLLVVLDVGNHHINTLLSLLKLVSLRFLHVLFDGFGSLHTEIVFDNIYVFINLSDLLIRINESQG